MARHPTSPAKGVANPLALLLAAGLMLDHVNRSDLANPLRGAVLKTLQQDGVRTRDLGGQATTRDFAAAIVRRLLISPGRSGRHRCRTNLGNRKRVRYRPKDPLPRVRPKSAESADVHVEEQLDEALEETFPSSDPVAVKVTR